MAERVEIVAMLDCVTVAVEPVATVFEFVPPNTAYHCSLDGRPYSVNVVLQSHELNVYVEPWYSEGVLYELHVSPVGYPSATYSDTVLIPLCVTVVPDDVLTVGKVPSNVAYQDPLGRPDCEKVVIHVQLPRLTFELP